MCLLVKEQHKVHAHEPVDVVLCSEEQFNKKLWLPFLLLSLYNRSADCNEGIIFLQCVIHPLSMCQILKSQ